MKAVEPELVKQDLISLFHSLANDEQVSQCHPGIVLLL